MVLFLSDGTQIRGDLIRSATVRSDLAPVPVTLEAEIRSDDSMEALLAVGELVSTGGGDSLRIVRSVRVAERDVQGEREMAAMRITALLDACEPIAYVRSRAIIKEGATLAAIYRAAGATIKGVEADFPVPRFYCPVGDTPTFQIARVLQEQGGAVRWRNGGLQFKRLPDLFKQEPAKTLPDNASDDVESGFMERHQVPWFLSIDAAGAAVFGNRDKPRVARFSPFKDELQLRNMTRCLVHRKTMRITLDGQLCAGDLVEFAGGEKLAIITAAHCFASGTDDGGTADTYTRLWLGSLEE